MKSIDDIGNFIFLEDKPERSDIIFIPGGSYSELGERAATLYQNGYANLILPSGKYNPKRGCFAGPSSKINIYNEEYKTEWEFFKGVLLKNNVDENAILKEDCAENTYENAFKSRQVTDELGLDIRKAIICCKSFHSRRSYMYYKWAYPETKLIMCTSDVNDIKKTNWFETDKGIEKVMNELSKCGSQFKSYFKEVILENEVHKQFTEN
ncbi:YdcF family protein [Clostridium ihumii]|uniref:YdcF family protein n=1 Tax=Clostridium ihumii TaxID=1470356 RepID=UPI00058E8341|nr:YdcF family protein [Clostridium ihumii]